MNDGQSGPKLEVLVLYSFKQERISGDMCKYEESVASSKDMMLQVQSAFLSLPYNGNNMGDVFILYNNVQKGQT